MRELIILACSRLSFTTASRRSPCGDASCHCLLPIFVGVNGFHPHAVFYFSVGAHGYPQAPHELTISLAGRDSRAIGFGAWSGAYPQPYTEYPPYHRGTYFISAITFLCGWLFKQDLSQPLFRWFDKMGKYVFFIFVSTQYLSHQLCKRVQAQADGFVYRLCFGVDRDIGFFGTAVGDGVDSHL